MIISLVLMLLLMGITLSICTTVFKGSGTQNTEATFTRIIQEVGEISKEASGARRLFSGKLNKDTAIIGFSKGKEDLVIELEGISYYPKIPIHKFQSCEEESCICFCDKPYLEYSTPASELLLELKCKYQSCIKGSDFSGSKDLDIHPKIYGQEIVHEGHKYTERFLRTSRSESRKVKSTMTNGFFIFRGTVSANHKSKEQGQHYTMLISTYPGKSVPVPFTMNLRGDKIAMCINPTLASCGMELPPQPDTPDLIV